MWPTEDDPDLQMTRGSVYGSNPVHKERPPYTDARRICVLVRWPTEDDPDLQMPRGSVYGFV